MNLKYKRKTLSSYGVETKNLQYIFNCYSKNLYSFGLKKRFFGIDFFNGTISNDPSVIKLIILSLQDVSEMLIMSMSKNLTYGVEI